MNVEKEERKGKLRFVGMNMQKRLFTECVDIVGTACKPFEGEKNYISTGAVDCDHISLPDTETIDYEGRPSRANLVVEVGDVIFAKMQATQKTLLIDEELAQNVYSTGFCAVRAKRNILTNRCLYHLLTSDMFLSQKDKNCSGATQKAITNAGLSKIRIQTPDIGEQDRISVILDEFSDVIVKRKQELLRLDDLIKARFVEMFGDTKYAFEKWGGKPFNEITINLDSKRKPVKDTERQKMQGPYPYYGATGVVDYVNDYRQEGTFLLISEDGKALEYRNKPIAFIASGKIWVNNHAHVQQCTEECNMIYLMYLINMMDISQWVTGIDQKKLNRDNLNSILIALPPIELQVQFENIVKQVDKSKVAVQKALDEAQLLFDSLMQEFFG